MTSLTRHELAVRAGVSVDVVDRWVELKILVPSEGAKPFRAGDVYRIRLVLACERAGLRPEAVGEAIAAGKLSFSFMDLPHYRWAALSLKSYRELADETELPLDVVLDVVQSLGYARPAPDDRIREDDLEVFPLIRFASTIMEADTMLRTARVYADALRRISDAEAALFDSLVLGRFLRDGLSYREAVERANEFGSEIPPLQERFLLTAYRREQERRWTDYTVQGIETVLEDMGLHERPARPPAFAFVDLAGYTQLTEERGDEAAARLAADLSGMVDKVSRELHGESAKWLGDGVMVYFKNPGDAVSATLEMVRRAPQVGLPAHAGVAAGPVVFQDGDYFGRTVNMAARIAARATAGQTLVTEEVAELASGRGRAFREVGSVDLKGFSRPIRVYEARFA